MNNTMRVSLFASLVLVSLGLSGPAQAQQAAQAASIASLALGLIENPAERPLGTVIEDHASLFEVEVAHQRGILIG